MENSIERIEMREQLPEAAPVRLPIRVIGIGVAAAIFVSPLLALWGAVDSLLAGDRSGAGSLVAFGAVMATFAATWGRKILRAVRTGVDPDSEERLLLEASSRAMLTAVRRTEPADPAA